MKVDAFGVVRAFEAELCNYTGARYAVTTNSCTMAILLAFAYLRRRAFPMVVRVPKRTYVGVPMAIHHAGHAVVFEDIEWKGQYNLSYGQHRLLSPIWDSARLFTSGMYVPDRMQCVSFHWSKTLGIQQGGAILHNDPDADKWLRRARFDGRAEGVPPADDKGIIMGWHCYMSPEVAAEGLVRLSHLPMHNDPLPNSDYPDLSTLECFK